MNKKISILFIVSILTSSVFGQFVGKDNLSISLFYMQKNELDSAKKYIDLSATDDALKTTAKITIVIQENNMAKTIEEQFKDQANQYFKKVIKSKVAIILFIVVILLAFSYRSFFIYIQPNQMGLKQINISLFGKQGLQKKVYQSGFQFKLPIIQEFYYISKRSVDLRAS